MKEEDESGTDSIKDVRRVMGVHVVGGRTEIVSHLDPKFRIATWRGKLFHTQNVVQSMIYIEYQVDKKEKNESQ